MTLDIVKSYLSEITIATPRQLVEAVGVCGSLIDCWSIDGISGRQFRRFLPKEVRKKSYIEFDVPKKTGGVRHISAPVEELKKIQQALNLMLQALADFSPCATGFITGKSVVDNAKIHLGQSVVFNCDLKNFFPSITKEMVRKALRSQLWDKMSSREVINMICSIATVPDENGVERLPQGAPTSPVLSNIVLAELDRRLEGFASANGYRYSRYADDISFSHSHSEQTMRPEKIATIFSIIEEYGLTVNEKKTKVSTRAERQEVTGLTVGDKVNVSRRYVKELRVLLHLWEKRGFDEAQQIFTRDFCNGIETALNTAVNGKINYLAMVKGREDSTYKKLKWRYRRLMRQLKKFI